MIVGASTALALIVSVVGHQSALIDSVRQRGRELAVRAAIGAQRRHIIRQVLIEAGRLGAAGIVTDVYPGLAALSSPKRSAHTAAETP